MDVDVFAQAHRSQWDRLTSLAGKRRLSGAEADELVRLYRRGAAQLSVLRSTAPDPALVSELSITLVKARARIVSPQDLTLRKVFGFVFGTVPAALYRVRWWSVGMMVGFLAVSVGCGFWTSAHPDALELFMTPAQQEDYANEAFAQYYSTYPNTSFSMQVWTNNARVAALCVATGITGLMPIQILFDNALNTGMVAAVMHTHDASWVFYSLILPHGLLELSCIFVAGAVGLRLMWAWLVPGSRTRSASLAFEGKTAIVNVLSLTAFLLISGLIEGFVTPSGMDPQVKIGIGALACALLWVTMFWLGRVAAENHSPGMTDQEVLSEIATV
ncbi:MAG: stage II sporulation protein M [Propionibacteriaceae bacterium]|nr:stage II sporulation protein M [Propionibacteriaceae bacterium]